MWRGGPDGGEGRRGAEVTGVGAAGAAGDEGRTRGTGIGRGPIRIGARGRKGIGGEEWLRLGFRSLDRGE